MTRAKYTSIRIKEDKNLKRKFNKLFPNKSQTDTLEVLVDNYSKVGAEDDKQAIWISKETYRKLNKMGNVDQTWDDVIVELIERKKVKPY